MIGHDYLLKGNEFISQSKIEIYKQHCKDLKYLKYLVRKYVKEKYNEIFRYSKKNLDNYVAYTGNFKSVSKRTNNGEKPAYYKINNEANEKFCKYIKGIFINLVDKIEPEDQEEFNRFMERLNLRNDFMPKQVSIDNAVIPYQLYKYQLKKLLENSAKFYPFLTEKDEDNLTVIDKLLSIIEFRIPYYVGPLNNYHGKFSWIIRKAEGKILPWNFDKKVDLDKSEEAFIRRMTCKCTYLAGEDVLCKESLLYSKFMVLNEINKIRIDDNPIDVECKQKLYIDLFLNSKQKVTKNRIKEWLVSNNYMTAQQEIKGIDEEIKSSLRSYNDFKKYLQSGILNETQIENIIFRISVTTDKKRLKDYLRNNYPVLANGDIAYISNLNYKGFGRLSNKLLTGIVAFVPEIKEYVNIIGALLKTNYNLMQLLSDNFEFVKIIRNHNEQYYSENPVSINTMLDEMYISSAVRRPIFRTISIVKEIKSIMKDKPKRIFIEMSRWNEKESKRTKSRKEQLLELYKSLDEEYREKWMELLQGESEDRLKSERLFLYYMQLGRCMYSEEVIDLNNLMSETYDIDHIYPQSKVKDDSVHNNKVLVLSRYNRMKGDSYPLNPEWQKKMSGYWNMLASKNLITKEKLYRLKRITPFNDEELANFINRQLVETQQSTKAITYVLKKLFPKSEIVYVKAGLVSDFRQQFKFLKCREINDLHHAKDAYLNIVLGNAYYVKFTKNPLNFIKSGEKYSVNIKERNGFLSRDIVRNGEVAWKSDGSTLNTIRKYMIKNNINYVRFAYCRKGGFFDQNPIKDANANDMLVPRKKNLPVIKYGGYNNTTASFFTLVIHEENGQKCISIKPIELLFADKFVSDDSFAENYCRERLGLNNPKILSFGKILKINSIISLDGFRLAIVQKSNMGRTIVLASHIPLVLCPELEEYVRKINTVINKAKKNRTDLKIYEEYDGINEEMNVKLYDELTNKCKANIFNKLSVFAKVQRTLKDGREKFIGLSVEEQVEVLKNIVDVFRTGRTTGCDLSKIGGSAKSDVITLNANLSSSKFKSIEIIDQSPTGLFEKRSGNILEL